MISSCSSWGLTKTADWVQCAFMLLLLMVRACGKRIGQLSRMVAAIDDIKVAASLCCSWRAMQLIVNIVAWQQPYVV